VSFPKDDPNHYALTHVALVNSAFNLTQIEKPAEQRAPDEGAEQPVSAPTL
jgi:hypothetical protein